jgi:hypothetical protein
LVDGGRGGKRSREGEKVGRTHCAESSRANVVGWSTRKKYGDGCES